MVGGREGERKRGRKRGDSSLEATLGLYLEAY